jgi:hypothetical protein
MAAITDLEDERRRRRTTPGGKAATIRTTPEDPTDKVMVSINAQPGYLRGPCPWPQAGPIPQVGDAAAVVELDNGELWVVQVWSENPLFTP